MTYVWESQWRYYPTPPHPTPHPPPMNTCPNRQPQRSFMCKFTKTLKHAPPHPTQQNTTGFCLSLDVKPTGGPTQTVGGQKAPIPVVEMEKEISGNSVWRQAWRKIRPKRRTWEAGGKAGHRLQAISSPEASRKSAYQWITFNEGKNNGSHKHHCPLKAVVQLYL